jgi:orotidine-5'-phosphate decarboxylase
MMEAAKAAIESSTHKPLLIGVTLLTSMDETTFHQIGLTGSMPDTVARLARLAKESGLDGVVCSAQEAQLLKTQLGQGFKLITPGIRPAGSAAGDQHRIMTPEQAIIAGSDYLVIGRPITGAPNPMSALSDIEASLP